MFLTPLAFSNCFTAIEDQFESCEKTYILPHELAMTPDGIFVKVQDQWFQTEALFSDIGGIFFQNLKRGECSEKYYVPCRNCGRCVHEVYDICPFCNKPV